MTTYDVTFNTVDGKSLIKRNVESDHENARVWEDTVERFDADHLYIKMNDKTMVSLLRRAVVRIDMTELPSDVEKKANRRDEFRNAMYTLSQIGL
ncbi:chromosome partitioning protein ParB [Lacticaseibacillus paracasei]|uniref:chromosome partitioning protein ParB n=1 Tax=Lacticaseibacillus paracasei TaxID=1597 RepID=UPI0031F5FF94